MRSLGCHDWMSYESLDTGIPHGLIEPTTVDREVIEWEGKNVIVRK